MSDHEVPSHRSVLAVFTPSAADARVLAAFTVGRSHELATLTRALAEAATSRSRPHVLLVGSRGSGKSHLLTLAAHHAITEPLGGPINLAWLPEEIYSITSYRDLLAEILSHVVDARPAPTTQVDSLERQLAEMAQSGVIVVLIENLHRIMALIGPQGQRALRAFLHNEQALLILASTPSLFEGITSHEEPFYGAFRVVQLGELSVDEGRELLLRLARLDGDEELGRFLSSSTGLARLGAVAHLAGGLPRLWVLLAGCVTVDLLDELVPLFVKLLDELTPYYKARMDDLSPAKAKLVSGLCFARDGGALTVRQLAEHVDSSQQSVSKLLNELERERFVVGRKVAGTDQRGTYYELREPLLRHCLELKSSRGGAPLAVIVEILRGWYDAQVLRAVLAGAPAGSPSEDYARAALMSGARPEPIDRAYASGVPADLVAELRLGWRSAGPASTRLAIEAMALLATHGKGAAISLLDARVANLTSSDAERARALFAKALEVGGEGTGAEQLARSLCAALTVDDGSDRLLSLVTGGWLVSQEEYGTARSVLERALDDRGTSSGDQISLAIGAELAFALWELGLRSDAGALGDQILAARMRFLGPDDPDTLTSRGNLADWTGDAGEPAAARDLFADLVADRRRVLGAEHPDTLASRHGHAGWAGEAGEPDVARDLLAHLVADRSRILGSEHPDTLASRHDHAHWTGEAGERAVARDLLADLVSDRSRILGSEHPDTLASRHDHAHWTGEAGERAVARDLLADLVADRSRVVGAEHSSTLASRHNLAHWIGEAGDPAAARDLLADLVADRSRVLGAEHPETLATRHNHAGWTGEAGDPAAARDLFADLVADRSRVLGAEHPSTLASRHNVAHWTGEAGDPAAARDHFADLVADSRVLGAEHPDTLATRHNHAGWTGEAGDPAAARDLFADLVADRSRVLGAEHADTLASRHSHAGWTGRAGDPAAARDLFAELVADRVQFLGAEQPGTLETRHSHAHWTGEAGDPAAARDLFADLVADRSRILGAEHPNTLASRHNLAGWTGEAGDPAAARDLFADLAADQRRVLGSEHPGVLQSIRGHFIWQAKAGDTIGALTEALSLARTTRAFEDDVGRLLGIVADEVRAPLAEQRYSDVLTSLGFSLAPLVRAFVVLVAHASDRTFATSSFLGAIEALGLSSSLLGALVVLRTFVDDPDQVLRELDAMVPGHVPELAPLRRVVKAAVATLDGDGAMLAGLAAEERALAEELAGLAVSAITI